MAIPVTKREVELMDSMLRELLREKYARDYVEWYTKRWGGRIEDIVWSAWGPEYNDHEWDGTKEPILELVNGLRKEKKWVAVEAATGTSKTFTASSIVYHFLDTIGGTVLLTAPKQQQLKDVLWAEIAAKFPKFKRLRPEAEMYTLRLFPDGRLAPGGEDMSDEELSEKKISKCIGIVAGVKKDEESATKIQGYHDEDMLTVVDEAAGVSKAVMAAIENTSSDPIRNQVLAIGNPDSIVDQLHVFSQRKGVKAIRISAFDFPNVVLNKNEPNVIKHRSYIPGAVTKASIDMRRENYGEDSNLYKSRVRGISPEQPIGSIVRMEWLKRISDPAFEPVSHGPSYNAVGVDPADSTTGDPAGVAYGERNVLKRLQQFQCPDASHLAYNLIYDEYDLAARGYHIFGIPTIQERHIQAGCVGIDTVGVGKSTFETLHNLPEWERVVALESASRQLDQAIPMDDQEKPLYAFQNLRAQMIWAFREDVRRGSIKIDIRDQGLLDRLFKQVVAHRYELSGNMTKITSKDKIKEDLGESPNLFDAVVYWNWVRKGHYLGGDFIPLM